MPLILNKINSGMARLINSRAIIFWATLLYTAYFSALLELSSPAIYVGLALSCVCWKYPFSTKSQILQLLLLAIYPIVGFAALIGAIVNWTYATFNTRGALLILSITVLITYFNLQLEIGLSTAIQGIYATVIGVTLPSLLAYIAIHTLLPHSKLNLSMEALWWAISTALVFLLADSGWLHIDHLTSPGARLLICLSMAVPQLFVGEIKPFRPSMPLSGKAALLAISAAIVFVYLLPKTPLSRVVFDESHGTWETTKSSFSPENFGRNFNYTYSLLPKFLVENGIQASTFDSEDADLPEVEAAFVIKMPTEEFSSDFKKRLVGWVKSGGRLIVILDHTDLYNTGQIANQLLVEFGFGVASNGVFDRLGSMNKVDNANGLRILGRVDDDSFVRHWQTGTSLLEAPVGAMKLASYGMGFSQPGDYSRANRFGNFEPSINLPFLNYTAVAVAPINKGLVTVILDSTPWSNFSFFKKQYKDLLLDILNVQSYDAHISTIRVIVWLILGAVTIFVFAPSVYVQSILIFALSVFFLSNLTITSSVGREIYASNSTAFIIGADANLSFLRQLVPAAEFNYSRVISSTAKYDLNPVAHEPGQLAKVNAYKKHAYIEPDLRQLPTRTELFKALSEGKNISIFFEFSQAADSEIQDWISKLGLFIQKTSGLSLSEDRQTASSSILLKRELLLSKDIGLQTLAKQTSLLKAEYGDALVQVYSLRPSTFPRTSGMLSISFAARQFSDDALGDVWEGIHPTTLGRQRERQFSGIIEADKNKVFAREQDLIFSGIHNSTTSLPAYTVFKDGNLFEQGKISRGYEYPLQINNPEESIRSIHSAAWHLVTSKCPRTGTVTKCKARLVTSNGLEWMVSWRAGKDKKPVMIELLHERRFASTGSTWNVVFSN